MIANSFDLEYVKSKLDLLDKTLFEILGEHTGSFKYAEKKVKAIEQEVNKWAKDMNGDPIVGQERFWQSSRALVFTQDFHHLTRFVENRANEGTMLVYAIGHGAKMKKWYWYVADFGIMFMARSAGFVGAYDIVFK